MGPPGWIGSCTGEAAVRPDLDSNLCCASSMHQAALTSVHAALCSVRFPESAPVRVTPGESCKTPRKQGRFLNVLLVRSMLGCSLNFCGQSALY